MKRPFCCDASRDQYESYYVTQSGNGLSVFQGSRGQKGHGLGSMLSGLFRSALPMIKRGLASFGKHALKTGLEVANDALEGKTFSDSLKERVPTGIKRFATNFMDQSGGGRKRAKVVRRRKRILKKKKKNSHCPTKKRATRRKRRDIFT